MKTAVFLINLGTPRLPTKNSVSKYLKEFLMDPYVIDIPSILRWSLVNFLIVPKRAGQSAHAYESIWTEAGSPLLVHSERFSAALEDSLSSDQKIPVYLGMRYGSPGIRETMELMRSEGVQRIITLPLYPHYAQATTRTALESLRSACLAMHWFPRIQILPEFYDQDFWAQAWADKIQEKIQDHDFILFSYHGLPVRQLKKNIPNLCYHSEKCCEKAIQSKQKCYKAQCLESTKKIIISLKNPPKFSTSFQSRLGKTEWIQPYTLEVIQELPKNGFKKILIVSPSFVTDCLETLEELGISLKKEFLQSGGEKFTLIPSLNQDQRWVHGTSNWIKKYL